MRRAGLGLLAVGAALLGLAAPALAGAVEVPIRLPMPSRLDVSGVRTILLTHYLDSDHPDIALSEEMVDQMRRLLEKGTPFRIIDVEPPHLPEQTVEDLLDNTEYWREMARRYGADLILSGRVDFRASDQSGFVQQEYISPITGQRTRRSRYAEREAHGLELEIFLFDGPTGKLAYDDFFTEEAVFEEKGVDSLYVFHGLLTRLESEILGILMPRNRTESRYLFTD